MSTPNDTLFPSDQLNFAHRTVSLVQRNVESNRLSETARDGIGRELRTDYMSRPPTTPPLSQMGLPIDGTIHRTVALQQARRSRSREEWPVRLPSPKGGQKEGGAQSLIGYSLNKDVASVSTYGNARKIPTKSSRISSFQISFGQVSRSHGARGSVARGARPVTRFTEGRSIDILGKSLALITWGKDRNGEDEVWVHAGTVQASGSGLVLDRGKDAPQVKLLSQWLPRIEPVSDELRTTLLGAELCLSLTIGPIPEGADPSEFEDIGLNELPDPD
jgi:hypothetical protein